MRILCLMFLSNPRLKCLIAPVEKWGLLCLVIESFRGLVALLMSGAEEYRGGGKQLYALSYQSIPVVRV